jgi:tRNA(fMet)-specific endonuclease VapC
MTLYMLDTDTVSQFVRGGAPALDARVVSVARKDLCISAVTRAELLFGLRLKPGAVRLAQLIEQFFQRVQSLPWDDAAAHHYAAIAADLHRTGTPIGGMDTMIAGHASALGAVLVSVNTRHFTRVTELRVENWCA